LALAITFPSTALIRKELLGNLRRTRSFVCLGIFVGAAISVAVGYYPEHMRDLTVAGAAATELVEIFAVVMFVGAVLFVPVLAGGSIATEKEQRTFEMLTLTPIPPSGLILAKLLNAVGFFLILVIASMPVLGVAFFLVRVGWADILQVSAVILATALCCAMVGILSSAWFRKPLEAIALAYLGTLVLLVGTALVACLLTVLFVVDMRDISRIMELCFKILSPIGTLQETALRGSVAWWQFTLAMIYQVAFFGICYGLAVLVLQRVREMPDVVGRKPFPGPTTFELRRKKFPFYLIDPLRRMRPIEDQRNPMLVKELRWGAMGRSTVLIRVFYTSLIVFLIIGTFVVILPMYSAGSQVDHTGALFMSLVMQIYITVIIAPALLANTLTKEYERGNVDMLRMTLLTPRDIVLGKVFAGAISLSPLLLAALLSSVPFAFVALSFPGSLALLFTGYITLMVCALVSLSLGLLASLISRRTAASIVLSYVLNIMVLGGFTLICLFIRDSIRSGPYSIAPWPSEQFAHFVSPIAAFYANPYYYRQWNLGNSLVNSYWLGNVATFTLLGLGIIKFCVARFARVGMRDR